jgi:hypothetical protein
MALPYDPHSEEAVAVAPLVPALIEEAGKVDHCSKCGRHIWLNLTTIDFVTKNEVQVFCPPCAAEFQEGK